MSNEPTDAVPDTMVVAQFYIDPRDDGWWVGVQASNGQCVEAGPYPTKEGAEEAAKALRDKAVELGALDVPDGPPN